MHLIRTPLDQFAAIPEERLTDCSWDDLRAVLPEVIEDIRVREINGTAKDALDYAENETTGRRCCRTLAVKDSHHESMRLDGWHEQARARLLPHHQLV